MTSSHLATMSSPWTGVVRPVASIGAGVVAGLGFVALALDITIAIARADSASDEQRPANANATVQRAAQNLPPARVILPAPWEQAAPAQPVTAPASPADHK
ncbi:MULTISPECIES: hypothetical protein [unclassified Bradyrhizobium]|uniref:hypothetical protein n=1 Tax=unclassified Bradyrhizobium TaxID=2631580 RepID=UPI001BA9AAF1|nr:MULTISPECIES: hypothetical protein [unclassified Bradyrhizobium]MBR1206218.1 hypothetical protein [Bradyrhizobium sp. AUGA SZCCT0124]MBR1315066.1 hypothetical protein [Bradyrhizobium sp. AUGA SZCCT0051]MBR1342037.1 hypothetical protein [Bradyrhizobium sp. AUGA SZCCT0105]MBR1358561.1 hypothetical protein [Bradyrhizobium sp. AUGA SZCCT0045]